MSMEDLKRTEMASPVATIDGYTQYGMTLRDYFAAKALVGICHFWVQTKTVTTINDPEPEIVATMAYEYADAMLKAREANP